GAHGGNYSRAGIRSRSRGSSETRAQNEEVGHHAGQHLRPRRQRHGDLRGAAKTRLRSRQASCPVMTRRKLIQLGAAAATVAAVGVAADGLLYEALEPRLTRVEVPLARLPEALDGLTVAQLSDFHYGPFTVTPIRRAVELVNGLKPDLIVLTGDFVTIPIWNEYLHVAKRAARAAEPCAELLAPLTAKLGKYVALGNHDRDSDPGFITECLQARGMPVLRNSSTPIEISGKRLWLAGVDDSLVGKPDLDVTLRNIPATEPVI